VEIHPELLRLTQKPWTIWLSLYGSVNFVYKYIPVPVDEQVARQRLGQHWFITEYIAAYIQGLYTVYKGARVQGAVANWFDR
jgi:hypothetical protein